jgi:Tfp pilus assembly protein PilV
MRIRSRCSDEDGFALITVLGTMAVVTLLLLGVLNVLVKDMKPSRASQDARTALAAAQAGLEEYLSRLNVNDTYWSTPADPVANPAFATAGVGAAVPGAATGGGSFRYKVLTTVADTAKSGRVRLQVTGLSGTTSRDLVAELVPAGFLRYIYFTDVEAFDPTFYGAVTAQYDGMSSGSVDGTGVNYTFRAYPSMVTAICSRRWYDGRDSPSYTTGTAAGTAPVLLVKSNGQVSTWTSPGHTITFSCNPLQFPGGDVINGPLKSNDALLITGSALFNGKVLTGWADGDTPAPTPGKRWLGSGTPSSAGSSPEYDGPLEMPSSNSELAVAAGTAGQGCVYQGGTKITFVKPTPLTAPWKMKVWSPATTSTSPGCLNTSPGQVGNEQTVDVPSVIYVKDATTCHSTVTSVGFPMAGEATGPYQGGATNGPGHTTDYDCHKGNAYVSGDVSGRTTVGTSNDIVITDDLVYANDDLTTPQFEGGDSLGLVPQNFAWVYHPVRSNGTNILTSPIRQIDAAILSVAHSFLVQNWDKGAVLSTSSDTSSKLNVRGAIGQKYRGPVGTTAGTGYLKNYVYDGRLAFAPPPYFLKPVTSPWLVLKVTD